MQFDDGQTPEGHPRERKRKGKGLVLETLHFPQVGGGGGTPERGKGKERV